MFRFGCPGVMIYPVVDEQFTIYFLKPPIFDGHVEIPIWTVPVRSGLDIVTIQIGNISVGPMLGHPAPKNLKTPHALKTNVFYETLRLWMMPESNL